MTGYTDTIRRYAADDRRVGILPDADGTGEVGLDAEEAGRKLAVRFTLRSRVGLVEKIRFQVFGCGFTIAACAAVAELAEGRPLDEALSIDASRIDAALGGLPEERTYCAVLAIEALHAAVQSVRNGAVVQASLQPPEEEDHGPRISAEDPLYSALTDNRVPSGVPRGDRHIFACLLAVAAQETTSVADALGLSPVELEAILGTYFPAFDRAPLFRPPLPAEEAAPEINEEVRSILLSHVQTDDGDKDIPASRWLAQILAARAAHPGHLWIAMGFFERPELTAAIRRHLPSLAAANHEGMRWKRYLFKQVCDLNGGTMCKSPNCGDCSDYRMCFGPD